MQTAGICPKPNLETRRPRNWPLRRHESVGPSRARASGRPPRAEGRRASRARACREGVGTLRRAPAVGRRRVVAREAAGALTPHFRSVIATDASREQSKLTLRHDRIEYL